MSLLPPTTHVLTPGASAPLDLGLRVELETTLAGQRELPTLSEHRLKIHAGTPVRGACSHHRFLYTRGDIDLQPAGYSDTWQEFQPNTSLIVQLSRGLLRRAAEELEIAPERVSLEPEHQFRDTQIEHIAWALEADQRADRANGTLFTESLGLALVARLLNRTSATRPVASTRESRGLAPAQLRRVVAFIEEHLDEDLSIARIATAAGISPSHFKVLFRRSMGMPVHQYVIQQRVGRARMLLERGGTTVTDVALAVGFAHQSHLARAMRRVLGVTPGAMIPR